MALTPGDIPVNATPGAYVRALAGAEPLLDAAAAQRAYGAALERWPDDELLLFAAAGQRYGNRDLAFKTISANLRQPHILAAGSSRVLQFRDQFFNRHPDEFYNVGAPAWALDQVEQLLHDLTYTPRILILGLDQAWFNDAYVPDVIDPPSTGSGDELRR